MIELTSNLALNRGLTTIGFTPLSAIQNKAPLESWLDNGMHGEMGWMESGRAVRLDPLLRFSHAQSAAVFIVKHHHQRPPKPAGRHGMVARYAWGRDYHNLIGKRLKRLQKDLRANGIDSWGGVDTAPILERAWAQAAGTGFTGKNTMQILPGRTSFFFIAVLFLPFPVPPVTPLGDHCGKCVRCLSGCPTSAFTKAHELDARKCISYWTIESKSMPPRLLRKEFGEWVFGCDVCQEVCPHNHKPDPATEDDFLPKHAWIDLDELLLSTESDFLEKYTGTPLRRTGWTRMKRNALLALANMKDTEAIPVIQRSLQDPAPLVRAAAVWALQNMDAHHLLPTTDTDPMVRFELATGET